METQINNFICISVIFLIYTTYISIFISMCNQMVTSEIKE